MKMSRKAKRYDDAVIPGDFQDFEPFQVGDPDREGRVVGALRRQGSKVDVGHLILECVPKKRQSFSKLRSKAERLTQHVDYLREKLEIVDHDRRGMYIQLRSLPPFKDDTQIQYNEICIRRDQVQIKRIAFSRKDEVKRQVPLTLTEDQLERLLGDMRSLLVVS